MYFFGIWIAASVAFVLGIVVGLLLRDALREEEVEADLAAARHVARREMTR